MARADAEDEAAQLAREQERRASRAAGGLRRLWTGIALAGALLLLSLSLFYMLQQTPGPGPSESAAIGEPLKLRLAPGLQSAKP